MPRRVAPEVCSPCHDRSVAGRTTESRVMFENTNFVIQQVQRVKKALQQAPLAGFEPDGKTAADVTAMLTEITALKAAVVTTDVALRASRGLRNVLANDIHDKSVAVYAAMRSVYRSDDAQLRAIRRIPKRDNSPRQILTRAEVTAGVWAQLPDVPDTTNPFKVGSLTVAAFNGAITTLRSSIEATEGSDSELAVKQSSLTTLTTQLGGFVSAVVSQGRSQFPAGTEARFWIETIPLTPGTELPGQAEITEATSPTAGVVHLTYEAANATSFTVRHKAPGTTEFVTIAEEVTDETFDAVGVTPGVHQYVVTGHNSRGAGETSAPASVEVALAAAA